MRIVGLILFLVALMAGIGSNLSSMVDVASVIIVFGGLLGIQPGAVIGKTNKEGTAVADREVDAGHLFHTYLQAVGLDSTADHDLPGRSIPIGDPSVEPIKELLA